MIEDNSISYARKVINWKSPIETVPREPEGTQKRQIKNMRSMYRMENFRGMESKRKEKLWKHRMPL
jgi:hypothetical protein